MPFIDHNSSEALIKSVTETISTLCSRYPRYEVVDFFSMCVCVCFCHFMKNVYTPSFCRAYEDLGLKHEPLTLIQPTFETPLPPLQPAVSENTSSAVSHDLEYEGEG